MEMKTAGVSPFGMALRACRLGRGLSQAELADMAGLSAQAVSMLERGVRRPRPATVRSLAEALELPPERRRFLLVAALTAVQPKG